MFMRVFILLFCFLFNSVHSNNLLRKWRRNLLIDPFWIPQNLDLPEAQWFDQTLGKYINMFILII